MKEKLFLKILMSAFALSGFMFFALIIIGLTIENTPQDDSLLFVGDITAFASQEKPSAGLPLRLKIPKINVDATIEYVGLTPDGAMDAPENQVNVAWFKLGNRPGDIGSAVIAGHYGWRAGKGSVFDNLYKLRKGDRLSIEDSKGVVTTFVVRESRRYDPGSDASNIFGSADGKSHLNLITCEGVLDKAAETYSLRLVVFTDKE